jgi:hypothetical protein
MGHLPGSSPQPTIMAGRPTDGHANLGWCALITQIG